METKFRILETPDYILGVSDEEIKEEDYQLVPMLSKVEKATKENIHLSYMCYKIIAYRSKGNAKELDLPLLPEIVVEDDVEKLAHDYLNKNYEYVWDDGDVKTFVAGHKAAIKTYGEVFDFLDKNNYLSDDRKILQEEFIQSLKQPKTPKYFIAETEEYVGIGGRFPQFDKLKTRTNFQDRQVLVGTYSYND